MAKRALIVGLGRSGKSAASYLARCGYSLAIFDDAFVAEGDPLSGVDLVVVSPGVPPSHPLMRRARDLGLEIVGELELGLRSLQGSCVGVTGTNGKTSVTHLTHAVLKAHRTHAYALGNIGTPITEACDQSTAECFSVIEVSSFQLESAQSRILEAAVVLKITPDHLDRHRTIEEYARLKARLLELVRPGGACYCHADTAARFPDLFPLARIRTFGLLQDSFLCTDGRHIFLDQKIEANVPFSYRRRRPCDLENLLAAFALCRSLGISGEEFEQGILQATALPHRMEWVRERGGVSYINDSKGTNVGATVAAVEGGDARCILIAGGRNKGGDFCAWQQPFSGRVRLVLAIGEARDAIFEALMPKVEVVRLSDLEEAVAVASDRAFPGETVILSPGCASYDQFASYEERGDCFRELVLRL